MENCFCCSFLGSHQSNEVCKGLYWKMASVFVYLFLPMAGLTIIWYKNEFLVKLWNDVEKFLPPVAIQSFGRRQILLNWAKRRLPHHWSSYSETLSGGICDIWTDGSLLCTLINTAVPGACPNPYRHWQKSPTHAQEVAYKYLGVCKMFSDADFSSPLTPFLERKLIVYLTLIQKAVSKIEKDKLLYGFISTRFVVRGMGLYTGEQFKESEFYIYSKIQNPSFYNVEIYILGPYSTQCKTTVLESLVKEGKRKTSHSKEGNGWLKAKETYLGKLRNLSDFEMNLRNSIEVRVEMECDRVKVSYKSKNYGIHEINLSCNDEIILGSPFYVNILKNSDANNDNKTENNKNGIITQNSIEENVISLGKVENNVICENKANNSKQKYFTNMQEKNIDSNVKNVANIIKDKNTNETYSKINEQKSNTATTDTNVQNINKVQNSTHENLISNSRIIESVNIVDSRSKADNVSFISNNRDSLEISKYLKDLNIEPKQNKPLLNTLDSTNDKNSPYYFSKENFVSFQRAVDSSFRKSCRITRKFPRIVQSSSPVVSCASPICSDHTVTEDFRQLSVEEKRKKFSQQKSSPLSSKTQRTSSLVSLNENHQEQICEQVEQDNSEEQPISKSNVSDTPKIFNNIYKKFNNTDNIDNIKKDEDIKLCKLVKEKKLFWETVFYNANSHNGSTSNKKPNNDNLDINSSKSRSNSILKHTDSFSLLRTKSFSRSTGDLKSSENKKLLLTYKSMDKNLDQCCNMSLEDRTKLYLNSVSNLQSKSSDERKGSLKEGPTWKQADEYSENSVQYDVNPKPGQKSQHLLTKTHRRSTEYFRKLELGSLKTKLFVNKMGLYSGTHFKCIYKLDNDSKIYSNNKLPTNQDFPVSNSCLEGNVNSENMMAGHDKYFKCVKSEMNENYMFEVLY